MLWPVGVTLVEHFLLSTTVHGYVALMLNQDVILFAFCIAHSLSLSTLVFIIHVRP